MVAIKARANIRWLGPLPIWGRPTTAGLRIQNTQQAGQPAILRFDHDEFMEEYLATLNSEPERLGEWLAQPETWRDPMASPTRAAREIKENSSVAFLMNKTRRLTRELKVARSGNQAQSLNLRPLKTRVTTDPVVDAALLPFKLFQATHKRHYLVTASLISGEAGLPDCEPDLRHREQTGFVIRRLLPPEGDDEKAPLDSWDEYAFVPGARGNSWYNIGRHNATGTQRLIANEETLPLFPVNFHNGCDNERRLHTGVIPVSRREVWMGASVEGEPPAGGALENSAANGSSMASLLLQTDVVAPWRLLLEQAEFKKNAAAKTFTNFPGDSEADTRAQAEDRKHLLRTSRDELQTGSWYVLLDFARFLEKQLPDIWQVLTGAADAEALADDEQALVGLLRATGLSWQLASAIVTRYWYFSYPSAGWGVRAVPEAARYSFLHVKWNLAEAIVAARAAEQGLETVDTLFSRYTDNNDLVEIDGNWPGFLFPLADPDYTAPMPAVPASELTGLSGLDRAQAAVDALAAKIEALLPPVAATLIESVPVGDHREGWFVVRCVYERPNCGPLFPALVSAPTQKFQMASFFDPDAPARPVRIPMPLDISPAGLRKYQKNTGFVISDMLCGKIKKMRGLTFGDLVLSVLPWPFHKDLPNLDKTGPCKEGDGGNIGMICSLSIPVVTICALVLMMIVVALFDLFFRWIPYLFVCLPIPGLKGKKG